MQGVLLRTIPLVCNSGTLRTRRVYVPDGCGRARQHDRAVEIVYDTNRPLDPPVVHSIPNACYHPFQPHPAIG
jgi:hypothetical protein